MVYAVAAFFSTYFYYRRLRRVNMHFFCVREPAWLLGISVLRGHEGLDKISVKLDSASRS